MFFGQYVDKLGFPTDQYSFVDVLSTDDWALDMVPKPVLAVLMLFPIKDAVSGDHSASLLLCVGFHAVALAPAPSRCVLCCCVTSLKSTLRRSMRRSWRVAARCCHPPCTTPNKAGLLSFDVVYEMEGMIILLTMVTCVLLLLMVVLVGAVISNACGTIGLLHSVMNAATPSGGPVTLRT